MTTFNLFYYFILMKTNRFFAFLSGTMLLFCFACSPSYTEEQAIALFENGQEDKAKIAFEQLLQNDPTLYATKYYLTIIKSKKGDFRGGLSQAFTLLKENPKDARVANCIGMNYFHLAILDSALAYFDYSIQLDTAYAKAFYNRGLAKANRKDTLGACIDWKRAKQLKYENANGFLKNYCK